MSQPSRGLWTRQATDEELWTLLMGIRDRFGITPAWMFLESPTECRFTDPSAFDICRLATAWQVRLFCPSYELAARRWDFERERTWLVRYAGEVAPAGALSWYVWACASAMAPVEGGEDPSVVTEWHPDPQAPTGGSTIEIFLLRKPNSQERTSDETRFATAELDYPVGESPPNLADRARLIASRWDHPGGPIICWTKLELHATSIAAPVAAGQVKTTDPTANG
jgi:hypothetical protein